MANVNLKQIIKETIIEKELNMKSLSDDDKRVLLMEGDISFKKFNELCDKLDISFSISIL